PAWPASVTCRVPISSSTRLRVAENITELVGETPMLHLRRLEPVGGSEVFAKLEYLNPGGSVKDRAAIGIIRQAVRDGRLTAAGKIREGRAGNTGIGLGVMWWNCQCEGGFLLSHLFGGEQVYR